MLLSRHPYAQSSGRAVMLRQRIEQVRRLFEPTIIVFGKRGGGAHDDGLTFLPLASPIAIALNAFRYARLPMQTWLYYSRDAHLCISRLAAQTRAKAIYVDMLRLAPLADGVSGALIIDYDDLLSVRYVRAAARGYDVMGFLSQRVGLLAPVARMFARPILRAEAARCAAYERQMLQVCDLAFFTSAREAKVMGSDKAVAAPPLMAARPEVSSVGRRLIFLGNMLYAENVSMLRSLADAMPTLAPLAEDVVIDVIGDYPAALPDQFDRKRFRFLGRVDDLDSLAGAGVFLAPATSGSGVKLKVLDGMALGCPVVATPKGMEGLSAQAYRAALTAADPCSVLRTAIALRDREALKLMLARRAQAYVRKTHAMALGDAVGDAIAAAVAHKQSRQDTL
jgi:glycosyltransferase involved in cell wall biosynthesis